jgi:hypothetical protein
MLTLLYKDFQYLIKFINENITVKLRLPLEEKFIFSNSIHVYLITHFKFKKLKFIIFTYLLLFIYLLFMILFICVITSA